MDLVTEAFTAGEDFVKNRVIDLKNKYLIEERNHLNEKGNKSSKLKTKISVLNELLNEIKISSYK